MPLRHRARVYPDRHMYRHAGLRITGFLVTVNERLHPLDRCCACYGDDCPPAGPMSTDGCANHCCPSTLFLHESSSDDVTFPRPLHDFMVYSSGLVDLSTVLSQSSSAYPYTNGILWGILWAPLKGCLAERRLPEPVGQVYLNSEILPFCIAQSLQRHYISDSTSYINNIYVRPMSMATKCALRASSPTPETQRKCDPNRGWRCSRQKRSRIMHKSAGPEVNRKDGGKVERDFNRSRSPYVHPSFNILQLPCLTFPSHIAIFSTTTYILFADLSAVKSKTSDLIVAEHQAEESERENEKAATQSVFTRVRRRRDAPTHSVLHGKLTSRALPRPPFHHNRLPPVWFPSPLNVVNPLRAEDDHYGSQNHALVHAPPHPLMTNCILRDHWQTNALKRNTRSNISRSESCPSSTVSTQNSEGPITTSSIISQATSSYSSTPMDVRFPAERSSTPG